MVKYNKSFPFVDVQIHRISVVNVLDQCPLLSIQFVVQKFAQLIHSPSNMAKLKLMQKCQLEIGSYQVTEPHVKTIFKSDSKIIINSKLNTLAIWFLPKDNAYGAWPASGSIDLLFARGNRNYTNAEGKHIGVEQFTSTLHYGPFASLDEYQTSQYLRNSKPGNGFNNDFHRYQMEWTPGNPVY